MKESLRDRSINKNLIQKISSSKSSFTTAIRHRKVISQFVSIRENLRAFVHKKSLKLRNWSLNQTIRILFKNRKKSMVLSISLASRNVTRSKYRSFLLIFGILMTIALETGIVVSIDTLYDDFLYDSGNQNFTDITVLPTTWVDLTTLEVLANNVRKTSGVVKAGEVYWITASQLSQEQIPGNLLIYGINSKTHPDFSSLNVTAGERKVSGNTIMISERLYRESGYEIGDSLNIGNSEFGDLTLESRQVTLGGVFSDQTFIGNKLGYYFILVDIKTLYDVVPDNLRNESLKKEVNVRVENLLKIRHVKQNIEDRIGVDYLVWMQKDISEIEATGIRSYQTAMNLIILASFLVEFLFITNILAIAIRDRSKEFGILRALGTNSGLLIESITIEILIYSVVGSILGIIVGIGLAAFLIQLMEGFYPALDFQALSIHPSSILATFSSGVIVALISGLYPIFIAITLPVVQNIHSRMRSGNGTLKLTAYWKYTTLMGITLAITGFILQFFVGPSRFLDFEILSIHFVVVLLIFIGTLLFEIGILIFLPRVAMRVLFWFGIIIRTISTRNIAREFQKSLFTIMTSALALTFIIVVGLVSAAVVAAVPGYFRDQWGTIDLVGEVRDGQEEIDFVEQVEYHGRVRRASFIQESRTELNGTEIKGIQSYVFGVDAHRYASFAEDTIDAIEPFPSYFFLNQTYGNYSTNITYGLISDILYQNIQTPVGSNVSVKIQDNSTVNVTIAAIIKSNVFTGDGEYMYISYPRFYEFFNHSYVKWILCDVDGDLPTAQASVERAFSNSFIPGGVMAIDFYTEAIERSLVFQAAIFQVLFIESFILAAIAQFVCILVSTFRMEREMGIMRSLGLHKKGVLGIFMAESTALGFSALIIGLIDGLLGSVLLAWYISLSIPVEVTFPLERVLIWVFASFIITLASTYLPSYRSSQQNIVATISGRPMSKQYRLRSLVGNTSPQSHYSFWSQREVSIKPDSRLELKPAVLGNQQEQSFYDYSNQTTSFWKFFKEHGLQIQTVFLVLMAVFTFNYIFDGFIKLRGLVSSDILWDILTYIYLIFVSGILEFTTFPNPYNPLLFAVGLAAIGPISYYIICRSLPDFRILSFEFVKSLFIGLVMYILAIILLLCQLLIVGIFNLVILNPIETQIPMLDYLTLELIPLLAIVIIELLFLQRIWVYLIFRGFKNELNFFQRVKWVIKNGSKGQLKFIFLMLMHITLYIILSVIFDPNVDPASSFTSISPRNSPGLDPIAFLIITGFEVGFYLFLILFQLLQFQNQNLFSVPSSSLIQDEIITPTSSDTQLPLTSESSSQKHTHE